MIVKVAGTVLPRLLGARQVTISPVGDTLRDVVEELAMRFGPAVKEELLDQGGGLDYCYAFFAEGERLTNISDKIKGDELSILSAVAGG